ncbi:MAG TPA: glycoside hydrolase family 99-like domain-containing protein [Acidimicrobiales bacterium]
MDVLALYLPQFHPIPENDQWWEPGFTEWTNVAAARPLFRGHRQPDLPGELGFYDLRVPEVRAHQADLASSHGISAFCWWHYWFAGTRLLERPFDEVLESGAPSLPFCLGWANQSWSGVWHGAPDRILIEQTYPENDDRAHFDSLLRAFRDPRYYRVDGRPLFLVFRPQELPDAAGFVDRWQAMAREAGLDGLYLVAFAETRAWGTQYDSHVEDGFDAAVHVAFPFERTPATRVRDKLRTSSERFGPGRYRYANDLASYPRTLRGVVHPCVYPNWDNTPRSQRRGSVVVDASPERFARHLRQATRRATLNPPGQQLVFIKSWNEWAEGNHLEPDRVHGRGWLEAVRDATAPE